MKKHLFLYVGVIFILLTPQGFTLLANSAETDNETDIKDEITLEDSLFYKEDVPIVYISASSDYEYGLKEGSILYDYYSHFIRFAKRWFGKVISREKNHVLHHIETLGNYYPSFLERMKGVSDALGIDLVDFVSIDMFFLSLFLRIGACTNTAVSSKVTSDKQPYVSWNFDLPYVFKPFFSRYIRSPPVIICDIEGKYKYVKISVLPSIFSFGLLNEHGLSYVGSTVNTEEEADGLSSLELNNLAMESCATVDEVADLYCSSERASGLINPYTLFGVTSNLNTLWADRNGEILLVEYNHSRIVTRKDYLFAETNHYQFLKQTYAEKSYGLGDFRGDSGVRLERAYELLHEYNGSIDIDFYQNILTCDHEGGIRKGKPDKSDICRHAPLYGTLCVIVTLPQQLGIYYCPGHPCRARFRYLDFSEELGNASS